MILTIGHRPPDSDSICSAIAAAELLQHRGLKAQAVCQGEPSRETQFILKQANVQAPEICHSVAGKEIWLVDYSDLAQAPDDIAQAKVLGLVDHHRLGDLITTDPIEAWIWPVGCTCTVLYNMYQIEQAPINPKTAILMMSAILSDTVGFASPTCTQKDKDAVMALAQIANVSDLKEFTKQLLIAKTDIVGLTATQLVAKDLKAYPFNDQKLVVGQLELATFDQVNHLIEELEQDLQRRCDEEQLKLAALMLTDITSGTTRLLYKGQWSSKLDDACNDQGQLIMLDTLSRKKQGWPWLQQKLNNVIL